MTRLIVISAENDLNGECELVNELFHAGLELFHLRKPLWSRKSQVDFFKKLDSRFHQRISVHQHHDCMEELGLTFCHIKEDQRRRTGLQKIENIIYSTSFHNATDLKAESGKWDYCFLSPVFDSISKSGYKAAVPRDLKIDGGNKVYALGGITTKNIEEVFQRGFFGAAVLGSVWLDPANAAKNFEALNKLCKQNAHMY